MELLTYIKESKQNATKNSKQGYMKLNVNRQNGVK